MNKKIFKYIAIGCMALSFGACNETEGDLLEPRVYFENKEYTIEVEDNSEQMSFDLTARLTTMAASQVDVIYSIADSSVIKEYNSRFGTNYQMFDTENVKLSSPSSVIKSGQLYADNVEIEISHLDVLEEGKTFVLPVSVRSNSIASLPGTNIAYFFITKPLKIKEVGQFWNSYISVRFPTGTFFKSFTYEALVNVSYFSGNETILGTEGVMIFRIGDTGGGTPKDCLEAAGRQKYNMTEGLQTNQWYHVALTYDQSSGKTGIYVNGVKKAGSEWALAGFDPNSDIGFNIGKLPGFQWGERPLMGYMSEIRVWSVARTENQLKQNMLNVDPKSEGLELYYKLDGSEKQENGYITDSTGKIKGSTNGIQIQTLDVPVTIE